MTGFTNFSNRYSVFQYMYYIYPNILWADWFFQVKYLLFYVFKRCVYLYPNVLAFRSMCDVPKRPSLKIIRQWRGGWPVKGLTLATPLIITRYHESLWINLDIFIILFSPLWHGDINNKCKLSIIMIQNNW